jgi:hypothetical protein
MFDFNVENGWKVMVSYLSKLNAKNDWRAGLPDMLLKVALCKFSSFFLSLVNNIPT